MRRLAAAKRGPATKENFYGRKLLPLTISDMVKLRLFPNKSAISCQLPLPLRVVRYIRVFIKNELR